MRVVVVFTWMVASVAAGGWRCPDAGDDCVENSEAGDEQYFRINGSRVICGWNGAQYLWLGCGGRALDDPRLPVLNRAATVSRAKLEDCAPPTTSYAAALAARNISITDRVTIISAGGIPLTNKHFNDLPPGLTLDLSGVTELQPDEDFLAHSQLGSLRLHNVTTTVRMLEYLPQSLISLSLEATNVTEITSTALSQLVNLSYLMIRESHDLSLNLGNSSVKSLLVRGKIAGMTMGPRLEKAWFFNIQSFSLMGPCSALKSLEVSGSKGGELQLGQCSQLQHLKVTDTPTLVREGALRGLRQLKSVILKNCSLTELPTHLLHDATNLVDLDVSYNNLHALPNLPSTLTSLDASSNHLGPEAARFVVEHLSKLETLLLSDNQLGDACGDKNTYTVLATNDVSLWSRLPLLRKLHLSRTGLTRLCADWRKAHTLTMLDLSHNNITELTCLDLQWTRSETTTVDLRHNPIRSIYYTQQQYLDALQFDSQEPQHTKLRLPRLMSCDCQSYWFAMSLRHAPRHAPNVTKVICDETSAPEARNKTLQNLEPSFLSCPITDAPCPASCRCVEAGFARVICEDVALQQLPHVGQELWEYVYELRLKGNDIEEVDVGKLPPRLEMLDLSNNSISTLSNDVISALEHINISLSNNPLLCDCATKPFIQYLHTNKHKVLDFEILNCSNGNALSTLILSDLCPTLSAGAVSGVIVSCIILSALFALGMILAAWKWLPDRLQRKLAFIARPFNFTFVEEEKEYKYDVFVSHAHGDWKIGKTVATLAEEAGMRACVHWRDWPPGGRISAQIAASVTASRKTAVLLSPRYIESPWARAELTAALADPLRVLVIKIDSEMEIPEDLAVFITSHTYLDWRDSRFKDKLIQALQPHKRVKVEYKKLPVGEPLDADKDSSSVGDEIKIIVENIAADISDCSTNSGTALVA